jgi:hypothetical protein
MAYSGKFNPKNIEKYRGDPTQIYYRSRWELKFLSMLDGNTDVIQYSSEEFCIPYINPFDNKYHRYFPDFWIKNKNGDNMVIEIKPWKQTIEPKKPNIKRLSESKVYVNAMTRYIINKKKWEAAELYCKKRGDRWKFIILTENELGIKF